jgi:hypothetical protein
VDTSLVVAVRWLQIFMQPQKSPDLAGGLSEPAAAPEDVRLVCTNGTWRADLRLQSVADRARITAALASGRVLCVIGDAGEVAATAAAANWANACVVCLDLKNSTAQISTSLSGLPPVFVFRGNGTTAISCPLLPPAARGSLEPDPDGIADTLRWGHPLDGRTLYANLKMAQANSKLSVTAEGGVDVESYAPWPSVQELGSLNRNEILAAQVAAFADAAGRIPTENAFVSLSGGLDSRTSLVGLLSHGRRVPCVTMAGSPKSLDAQLAHAFCQAYGLEHLIVPLGEEFSKRCPDLLLKAAELTGGVSCLSQTADLFLYESLPAALTTRISGNLGNQVGRGGVESLSAYRPRTDIFLPAIRERLATRPATPWFISRLSGENYGETLFGQEVPYWSVANYSVGSSRARQLTPYADYRLMQLARAAFARDPELSHPTWKMLRARDLRHRIAGTPKELSFQRQFLIRNDREGRKVPLNWGWRADGGWSVGWSVKAMASAADAAAIKFSTKSQLLRGPARWLSAKLDRRSALVAWPSLLRAQLRELTLDTFAARDVRQAGIFDLHALDEMLRQHFSGSADHYATVSRALEIAVGVSRWARASA